LRQYSVIRAELPAQCVKLPAQYIQQLPSIQTLLTHLEGKGRSPNTRLAYQKGLKALALRADLKDTKAVELAIARYKKKDGRPATNNYKSKLCDIYAMYCRLFKVIWEKPIYTPEPTTIQPPSPEKCSMLIAAAKRTLSIKIDISTQTGLRPIEIQGEKGLRVNNIHPDQNTITARITKGCNPRPPLPISKELMTRIQTHVTEHNLKPNDLLFTGDPTRYGEHFRRLRNRLAKKLNDPTIHNIRLYDLRHYYCTKQLRKTQNAEIVRQIMGHKKLDTTQKYLHLLAGNNGEWIVEGTTDKNRAQELLEADFTYQLTTPDGTMLFRKPK
jgi:integrase